MARIASSGVGQQRSGGAPAPVLPHGAAAWKPWTVGLAFIAAVVFALAGRAIVATDSADSTGALLGVGTALILLAVASVGVALLLASRHGKPSAADFALRRPPLGRAIARLIALWLGDRHSVQATSGAS